MPAIEFVMKDATISECGTYRYSLKRQWAGGLKLCVVMLNPSTADADLDDPTIRRVVGFAKSWGYDAIEVVNLFAYRATDPKRLLGVRDAVGPENDRHIERAARDSDMVVCGWGANPTRGRAAVVIDVLRRAGKEPMAFRLTKDGKPAHPLYLPASLTPVHLKTPPKGATS